MLKSIPGVVMLVHRKERGRKREGIEEKGRKKEEKG